MSFADDLLFEAKREVTRKRGKGRPKQAALRRAVSTAYYAIFHALLADMSRQMLGKAKGASPLARRLRRVASRASLARAAKVFRDWDKGTPPQAVKRARRDPVKAPSEALRELCSAFVELQEARLRADYDLECTFSSEETKRMVQRTSDAIALLPTLAQDDDYIVFLWHALLGESFRQNDN
jgi:hypothetical protein